MKRPNVLCMMTDQQRYDHLSCSGHPLLKTPNIDRLAASGVRFDRAYVNCPLCMPSRATLFTGRTPRGHGVRTNGVPLNPDIPTLTQALVNAGYRTHASGKLHFRTVQNVKGLPLEQHDPNVHVENRDLWLSGSITKLPSPYYGFQTTDFIGSHGDRVYGEYTQWLQGNHPEALPLLSRDYARVPPTGADQSWKSSLPAELHHTTWVADQTIKYLREEGKRQPFFLLCSFPDPHHPYCPPAPYDSLYDPADVPMPNRREGELEGLAPFFQEILEAGRVVSGRMTETRIRDEHLREIIAHTFGMIALIDHHIGRILDTLETEGLAEDTIVIFLSDHGDMMGDHWLLNKGPFHFEGLLRVPFIWSWPGRFREGVVSDALVSLLDFAPTLLDLCGVPFPEGDVPLETEAPQMLRPHPGHSLVPLLTGDADRVRERLTIENDEDYLGLRLRTLVTPRHKLTVYGGKPYGELFDLERDPQERHNRFSDPSCETLRHDLTAELLDELVLTDGVLPRRLNHA